MTALAEINRELGKASNSTDAEFLQRFFKTEPGQYGEGDLFRGIRVPALRQLVRRFSDVPVATAAALLKSKYHEDRLLALMLLVEKFLSGDHATRKQIYDLYLGNTRYINNWDLVDASAGSIVGGYLFDRSRAPLTRLARSKVLWERRIAIIATYHFIRQRDFDETLRVAEILLNDKHDLIHKAVGWMLREVGNRAPEVERSFLLEHYRGMPRTMLRYAIEKFPEPERKAYLLGTA